MRAGSDHRRSGLEFPVVVVGRTEGGDRVAVAGDRRPLLLLLHPLPPTLLFGHDAVGPHADGVTLFESAGLALAPHVHVDLTVIAVLAHVLGALALSDGAPEEAFAAFAGQRVVVIAGGAVTADEAEFFLGSLPGSVIASHASGWSRDFLVL